MDIVAYSAVSCSLLLPCPQVWFLLYLNFKPLRTETIFVPCFDNVSLWSVTRVPVIGRIQPKVSAPHNCFAALVLCVSIWSFKCAVLLSVDDQLL